MQRAIVMDCNHFNNRNIQMTEEEKAELPHYVLENFLADTQGYEEEDAFLHVLQNYDEVREQYYEHIKLN